MVPDDIEREARDLERGARCRVHAAAHEGDEEGRHRAAAELCGRRVAQDMGAAHGLAFRAAELRYDARGGMTAALERRRFEPGARWSLDGEEHTIGQADASGLERHLCSAEDLTLHWERIDRMTRANGWLFLGLADQGGYR